MMVDKARIGRVQRQLVHLYDDAISIIEAGLKVNGSIDAKAEQNAIGLCWNWLDEHDVQKPPPGFLEE